MEESFAVLASKRAAYVAAWTDHHVLEGETYGSLHCEPLTLDDFRVFAKSVWAAEGRTEALYVTRVEDLPKAIQEREFEGAAAAARWEVPRADKIGVPRTGELAGTTGPIPYIDVRDEGLVRLVALHELAHLLVDSIDSSMGHGGEWANAYGQLIQRHLGAELCALWQVQFRWWQEKAEQKIAADPTGWRSAQEAQSLVDRARRCVGQRHERRDGR